MRDKPDFEKLRAERNDAVNEMLGRLAIDHGLDPSQVSTSFDPNACYCTCGYDNPVCEHDFDGWREFEDGRGGEQVCKRCGLGAMSHSLRTGL